MIHLALWISSALFLGCVGLFVLWLIAAAFTRPVRSTAKPFVNRTLEMAVGNKVVIKEERKRDQDFTDRLYAHCRTKEYLDAQAVGVALRLRGEGLSDPDIAFETGDPEIAHKIELHLEGIRARDREWAERRRAQRREWDERNGLSNQ